MTDTVRSCEAYGNFLTFQCVHILIENQVSLAIINMTAFANQTMIDFLLMRKTKSSKCKIEYQTFGKRTHTSVVKSVYFQSDILQDIKNT